jgi:hypothetical protein
MRPSPKADPEGRERAWHERVHPEIQERLSDEHGADAEQQDQDDRLEPFIREARCERRAEPSGQNRPRSHRHDGGRKGVSWPRPRVPTRSAAQRRV